MEISFSPMTEKDFSLAERFKRATALAVMGDDKLFDVWFPPERSYAMYLGLRLAFDPESCAFLLVDGRVAGSVDLRMLTTGQGHMDNIYLEPEWRGRGLGEAMNDYAIRFFRKHRATFATLRTNPKQAKVVAFYERMGWKLGDAAEHGLVWMGKDVG